MDGRCQCGAVRFKTPLDEPLKIFICHCLECRWQASSSYGLSAIFPAFDFSDESRDNMAVWSRTTFRNRQKDCYFCKTCGSRIYHHCPGQKLFTVKAGCLEGLTKEMMDKGVHIWTKRSITPIPSDAEAYEEEPPGPDDEPMEQPQQE